MSPPVDPAKRFGCGNFDGWSPHGSLDLLGPAPTQQSLTGYIHSGLCWNAPLLSPRRGFLRRSFDDSWPLPMT